MSQLNDYEQEWLEEYYGKPIDEITQAEIDEYAEEMEAQIELREVE